MQKLIFSSSAFDFLKKNCSDTSYLKNKSIEDNECVFYLSNEQLEDLFWENLRDLAVDWKDEQGNIHSVQQLSNDDFVCLVELIKQSACAKDMLESISVRGIINKLIIEEKRRNFDMKIEDYFKSEGFKNIG
jgi:hypothetical protein